MTYGDYEHPTATRPPCTHYWNGANLESKSLLTYAALIFHELAPGHHFHTARQGENEALPDIRRYGAELGAFQRGVGGVRLGPRVHWPTGPASSS